MICLVRNYDLPHWSRLADLCHEIPQVEALSVKLVVLGCSALKDLLNTSLATSGMLTDQMHRCEAEKLVKRAGRLVALQIRDMPHI